MAPTYSSCPCFRRTIGCTFFMMAIGALGVAAWVFINGSEPLQTAQVLRLYQSEFEQFNGTCRVNQVRKCYRSTPDENPPDTARVNRNPDGQPHCWVEYKAIFSLPGGNRNYTAYPEFVLDGPRNCERTCEDIDVQRVPSGQFSTGAEYPCWRPTYRRIDVRYQCGNPSCYKLYDPNALVESAINDATFTCYLGGGLCLFGLITGCLSLCLYPSGGLKSHRAVIITSSTQRDPSDIKQPLTPSKAASAHDRV